MAKYNCKNCGAELYFKPEKGKLCCEYCDSEFDPSEFDYVPSDDEEAAAANDQFIPQSGNEGTTAEELAHTDAPASDDSLTDSGLVVYKCPHCGAEVITSKDTSATTCVYCGRAITFEGNMAGQFKPDYIIPFSVKRDEVEKAYKKLCASSLLTPKFFTRDSTIEKIKGIYVPFWSYTFHTNADLTISAKRTRTRTVGDYIETLTHEFRIDLKENCLFDDVLADALKAMDNDLMDAVEPFEMDKAVPFNPAYLAGFYSQKWDETMDENVQRAYNRAKKAVITEALARESSLGSTSVSAEHYDFDDDHISCVLLPVWMLYTEYKGKKYSFGMNGQTGKIIGKVPMDVKRLLLYIAGAFAAVQLIAMILRVLGVV